MNTPSIDKKITQVAVRKQATVETEKPEIATVIHLHEKLERPEVLHGATYKIYPGAESEHAMYITINDIILNPGTPYESRRPFEIFINTKNVKNYDWIVAITRLMSAVFRKGGDITFIIEELKSVFSPLGGYFKKGKFYNSIIHEIGGIIEKHLTEIGMLKKDDVEITQTKSIATKSATNEVNGYMFCEKCFTKGVVMEGGCSKCVNCGDSKCG